MLKHRELSTMNIVSDRRWPKSVRWINSSRYRSMNIEGTISWLKAVADDHQACISRSCRKCMSITSESHRSITLESILSVTTESEMVWTKEVVRTSTDGKSDKSSMYCRSYCRKYLGLRQRVVSVHQRVSSFKCQQVAYDYAGSSFRSSQRV